MARKKVTRELPFRVTRGPPSRIIETKKRWVIAKTITTEAE